MSVGEGLGWACVREVRKKTEEKEQRVRCVYVCYRFGADPGGGGDGDGLNPLSALFRRDLPNPRPIPSVRC